MDNCWLKLFSKGMEWTLNILEKKGKVGSISLDYLIRSLKYLKEMKQNNNNNNNKEELELINIETLNYLCDVFDEILKEETGNLQYLSNLQYSSNSNSFSSSCLNLCKSLDSNSSQSLSFEISLEHVKLVRLLFVLLNDDKGDKSGLNKVYNEKSGKYSWICGRRECYEKYEIEGDDCLLFHF